MSDRDARMDAHEDAETARLVRLWGGRPPIAAAREARVRATVHAHWQKQTRRRWMRRRVATVVTALGAAAVLVFALSGRARPERAASPAGVLVARVERLSLEALATASTGVDRRRVAVNDPVHTGEWIDTGTDGRLALRFLDGMSVRLDRDSRIRALSAHEIELTSGAVYIDTADHAGRVEVRTPVAIARDLGTQFEVRLLNHSLRLRVRTGLVELTSATRSVTARGGTEVAFSEANAASRPIPVHGAEWDWTASVAAPLDIEGLTLSAFLERVTREHGWELRYDDARLAREASGIVLHGSVRGLPIADAIEVAVDTSGLRARLEAGRLVVLRNVDSR